MMLPIKLREILKQTLFNIALTLLFSLCLCAQNAEPLRLASDIVNEDKTIELEKVFWKYRAGDDAAWAAEVGGDYYDFYLSENGTLTVAIGDATGHGLKAGSIVTATKSLFNAFAADEDIGGILNRTSAALKKMNLRGLFMAMTIFKIKNNNLTLAAAGMPAALIYRCAAKRVEEIALKALPLGSVAKFPYQQFETSIAPGDCIVLMSDGFPEMFNEKDEILGFEKAAATLPEIAGESAQTIINRLVAIGELWANGKPPDDDVTFVVLKVKSTENGDSQN